MADTDQEKSTKSLIPDKVTLIGNTDKRVDDSRKIWIADNETGIVGIYGREPVLKSLQTWLCRLSI